MKFWSFTESGTYAKIVLIAIASGFILMWLLSPAPTAKDFKEMAIAKRFQDSVIKYEGAGFLTKKEMATERKMRDSLEKHNPYEPKW
jgi:hypothetical protein